MNPIADNKEASEAVHSEVTAATAMTIIEASMAAQCRLLDLPKISDFRGNLTFIEGARHVPFAIKRVFYLYDVPSGTERAGHALKTCSQFIIAVSGSFNVIIDDGTQKFSFHLDRPYYGLYVPPKMWRDLDNFSSGSVCMILASEFYDENDYFHDYEEFLESLRKERR